MNTKKWLCGLPFTSYRYILIAVSFHALARMCASILRIKSITYVTIAIRAINAACAAYLACFADPPLLEPGLFPLLSFCPSPPRLFSSFFSFCFCFSFFFFSLLYPYRSPRRLKLDEYFFFFATFLCARNTEASIYARFFQQRN